MSKHITQAEILKRLKRATGHLSSVIKMIEEDAPCIEVAQQFHAVVSALSKAKQVYIQDHIDHCFDNDLFKNPKSAKEKLKEFKEITKFLQGK